MNNYKIYCENKKKLELLETLLGDGNVTPTEYKGVYEIRCSTIRFIEVMKLFNLTKETIWTM